MSELTVQTIRILQTPCLQTIRGLKIFRLQTVRVLKILCLQAIRALKIKLLTLCISVRHWLRRWSSFIGGLKSEMTN